jgi:hypothetical protein
MNRARSEEAVEFARMERNRKKAPDSVQLEGVLFDLARELKSSALEDLAISVGEAANLGHNVTREDTLEVLDRAMRSQS